MCGEKKEKNGARETLFRGKCSKTKEWAFGSLLIDYEQDLYMICWNRRDGLGNHGTRYQPVNNVVVGKETVGQYAGLRDKNGKRIFEGDIVECVSYNEFFRIGEKAEMEPFRRKFVVEFHEGCFAMREDYGGTVPPTYWTGLVKDGEYEIVGNVHDAPAKKGDQI